MKRWFKQLNAHSCEIIFLVIKYEFTFLLMRIWTQIRYTVILKFSCSDKGVINKLQNINNY